MALFDLGDRVAPGGSFLFRAMRGLLPKNRIGDRLFALAVFRRRVGKWPFRRGGDFNDFLYFFKVSRRFDDPLKAFVTDKLGVREYVKGTLGERYCIPVTAVLRSPEEVGAYDFPAECVIKPSHLSGEVVVRRQGEVLDRKRISSWFRRDYYLQGRERNYRRLEPRVIVEPFLPLDGGLEYKVHCLRGEPRAISVQQDLLGENFYYRYSTGWELIEKFHPLDPSVRVALLPRPKALEEVLRSARALAERFLYIRVDLLVSNGRVFVGEITHVPGSANMYVRDAGAWKVFSRSILGLKEFDMDDFPELR